MTMRLDHLQPTPSPRRDSQSHLQDCGNEKGIYGRSVQISGTIPQKAMKQLVRR